MHLGTHTRHQIICRQSPEDGKYGFGAAMFLRNCRSSEETPLCKATGRAEESLHILGHCDRRIISSTKRDQLSLVLFLSHSKYLVLEQLQQLWAEQ